MPYNSNDRLEQEAREALVAADLSARMKQWGKPGEPPNKNGGSKKYAFLLVFVAILCAGLAFLFWPMKKTPKPDIDTPTSPNLSAPLPEVQPIGTPGKETPIAKGAEPSRLLALAKKRYQTPDFGAEIRGESVQGEGWLNTARQALLQQEYTKALNALEKVPETYQTDIIYLRAHAYFGLNKYAQSADLFSQLNNSVRYGDAAQWYEILALLPNYAQNEAVLNKKMKKILEDEDNTFYREVKSLSLEL